MSEPNGRVGFPEEIDLSGIKYHRADVPREVITVDPDDLMGRIGERFHFVTTDLAKLQATLDVHGQVLRELQPLLHQLSLGTADANIELLFRNVLALQASQEKTINTLIQLGGLHTTLNARLSTIEESIDRIATTAGDGICEIMLDGAPLRELDRDAIARIDENAKLLVELMDQRTAPPPPTEAPEEADGLTVQEVVNHYIDDEIKARQLRATVDAVVDQQPLATAALLVSEAPAKRNRSRALSASDRRELFDTYVGDEDMTVDEVARLYNVRKGDAGKAINEVAQADGRIGELKRKREHMAVLRMERVRASNAARFQGR